MSCEEATSVSLGVCFQFRNSDSCSRSACQYAHVEPPPDPPLSPLWDDPIPVDENDSLWIESICSVFGVSASWSSKY